MQETRHLIRIGFVTTLVALWGFVTMLDASLTFGIVGSVIFTMAALIWHMHTAQSRQDAANALEKVLGKHATNAQDAQRTFLAASARFKRAQNVPATAWLDAPFYIAVGEADSGLATWLQHAGLTWPSERAVEAAGCTWWFAHECVVLRPTQKALAHHTLEALARYRGDAPVNGVLLTLRLEDLLTRTPAQLHTQAQTLRREVDSLQSTLQSRAPVYLVVTQCDALVGFTETFSRLGEHAREAVLGRNWAPHDAPIEQVVSQLDALMASVGQEALPLMHSSPTQLARERIYAFPDQLGTLRAPLMAWTNGFFEQGHGRAMPQMRGLYLCSAKQGTRLYDRFNAHATPEVEGAPASVAYFTQRIFAQGILPNNNLVTRADAPVYPLAAARFALAASMVLVMLPAMSYVRGLMRVNSARAVVTELAQERTTPAGTTLATLDALRDQVDDLTVATEAASAVNVQSGMSQDAALLDTLRALYLRTLRDVVLLPVVEQDAQQMALFAHNHASQPLIGQADYARYIDVLRTHVLLSGAYGDHTFDDTDASWLTAALTRRLSSTGMEDHVRYFIQAMRDDHALRLPRNADAMAAIRAALTKHNTAVALAGTTLDDWLLNPAPVAGRLAAK